MSCSSEHQHWATRSSSLSSPATDAVAVVAGASREWALHDRMRQTRASGQARDAGPKLRYRSSSRLLLSSARKYFPQVTRLTGTHFYGATVEPKSFVRATGSWRWSFIESTQVCRRQDTFGSARRKRYEPSAVQTSVTSFLIQRPRCSVHAITPNLAGDNGGISPWRGSYIGGLTNPVRAGGCFDSYDSDEVCPPGSSIEHHSIRRRCVAFIRWVSPTAVISTPPSDPAVRY